nr:synapse-associated protein 1-like [Oncorhynchus nerka]
MFKGWGTWLGIENTSTTEESEVADVAVEEKIVQDQNEVNKQHEPPATEELGQEDGDTVQLISQQAKGFGGLIFNFASNATKKISNSVAETAHTIKKSVEEGNIDGIFDKTILGDFKKEQDKFVQEKKAKKSGQCGDITSYPLEISLPSTPCTWCPQSNICHVHSKVII